jgi:hypothetical protein
MPMIPISLMFRSRVAQALALGGVITTGACKDATAPGQVETVEAPALLLAQSPVEELGDLSSSLDDMTGWALASLPEGQDRVRIVGILDGLRGHLKSGKIAASQQDVSEARGILESLSEQEQVEIGAVGVTLDLIQSALDKASQ